MAVRLRMRFMILWYVTFCHENEKKMSHPICSSFFSRTDAHTNILSYSCSLHWLIDQANFSRYFFFKITSNESLRDRKKCVVFWKGHKAFRRPQKKLKKWQWGRRKAILNSRHDASNPKYSYDKSFVSMTRPTVGEDGESQTPANSQKSPPTASIYATSCHGRTHLDTHVHKT